MPLAYIGFAAAFTCRRYPQRARGRCRASARQVFPKSRLHQGREGRGDFLLAGIRRSAFSRSPPIVIVARPHMPIIAPIGESGEDLWSRCFLSAAGAVARFFVEAGASLSKASICSRRCLSWSSAKNLSSPAYCARMVPVPVDEHKLRHQQAEDLRMLQVVI